MVPFFSGAFVFFTVFPFTPPTAFALRVERITKNTIIATITIAITTMAIMPKTGMQNPVACCHSPSTLPRTHALFCEPT